MAQLSDENLNKLLELALANQKGQAKASSEPSEEKRSKLLDFLENPNKLSPHANLGEYLGKGMLELFAKSNPLTALIYNNAGLLGNTLSDTINLFKKKDKKNNELLEAKNELDNSHKIGDNARIFIGDNSYSSFGDRANVRLGEGALLDSRGAMYARVQDLHTQSEILQAESMNSLLRAKNAIVYADNVIVVPRGGQGGDNGNNGNGINGLINGTRNQLLGQAQQMLTAKDTKLIGTAKSETKLLTTSGEALAGRQLPTASSKVASTLSKGLQGLGVAMRGLGTVLTKLVSPVGLAVLGIGVLALAIMGLANWLKNIKKHDEQNKNPEATPMSETNDIYKSSPTDNLRKLDNSLKEKQYWSKNDIATNYGDKLADGSTSDYTEYNTKEKQPVFSPIAGHVANGSKNDYKPEYRRSNQIGVWGTKGNFCVKIVDNSKKSGIVIEGLMEVTVHPNQVVKQNQSIGFATDKIRVYSVKNFTSVTPTAHTGAIIDNNFKTQDAEKQNFKNTENPNIKVGTGFRSAETYAQVANMDSLSQINDYQRDDKDPTKASGRATWDSLRSMGIKGGSINAKEMGKRKVEEGVSNAIDGIINDKPNGFGVDENSTSSVTDTGNKNATKASADADKLVAMNAENLAKLNSNPQPTEKIAQAPTVNEQGGGGSVLMFGIDDDHANISIYGGYTDVGLTV